VNIKKTIKKITQFIPSFIGCNIAFIPFNLRLGKSYDIYRSKAQETASTLTIFHEVKNLVIYAERNIEFYKIFYKNHNFSSTTLQTFDDLNKIPILTKADLQAANFETRITNIKSGITTNTGGSSGQPLELLLDYNAHAREWAHMHIIWETLGYKTSSPKLTLRGMNLGDTPLQYNFIHNEFQVNAYCKIEDVISALTKVMYTYKIEYIHGYPSGIYEFIKQIKASAPSLLSKFKSSLKGVFFGSEYPAPIYRAFIEKTLLVPTISWYGHSEMAVLAYEKEQPFVYHPFQSYGFTESVEIEGKQHLIGTTIHNKIGPLIRYDTGDIIEPVSYSKGLLASFKISEGRIGEFIIDNEGRNISLTALIFGRHHDIFSQADFIQVKQDSPGQLTVYVTSSDPNINCTNLFDFEGVDMTIQFKIVSKPFKTKAGKVPLIVKG
jgi:phenylacetate-CoA ligase